MWAGGVQVVWLPATECADIGGTSGQGVWAVSKSAGCVGEEYFYDEYEGSECGVVLQGIYYCVLGLWVVEYMSYLWYMVERLLHQAGRTT